MKDDQDFPELPVSNRPRTQALKAEVVPAPNPGLTERQMDQVIGAGAALATDLATVAKVLVTGYVDIRRIREQSAADCARIAQETEAFERRMAGQIGLVLASGSVLRDRGTVIQNIILAVTAQIQAIPVEDGEARRLAVENLPRFVEMAVHERVADRS
jgi:hypothetical protein